MSAAIKRQSSPFDTSVVAPAAPALAATDAPSPAGSRLRTPRPTTQRPLPTSPPARKARRASSGASGASVSSAPSQQISHEPLPLDEDGPLLLDIPSDAWFTHLDPLDPAADAPLYADRPRTRAQCADGPRPCPWVTCRYHLWAEVAFVPRRKLYRWRNDAPAPWEMRQTCSLDVAEEGGSTLEEVGTILGLTRERVRQLEAQALAKLTRFFKPEDREELLESIFR